MAILTVRNVPDEVHGALRRRAARNGKSMESEVRDILRRALKPESGIKIGDALRAIGRRSKLTNDDFEMFEKARYEMPAEPVRLE